MILAGTLLFLFLSFGLFAQRWPVEDKKVTTTFGTNMGDRFSTGIDITGMDGRVRAINDGEVVFYTDSSEYSGSVPSGLGNMVVVQHEDDLKSVYAHLKPGNSEMIKKENYKMAAGGEIGRIGDSGWTYGKTLRFLVIDSEFNQYVNPLLLLPAVDDSAAPVVRNVRLQYGDYKIPVKEGAVVAAGEYNVFVDIFDPCEHLIGRNPMAPFSIILYINGSQFRKITCEALKENEQGLVLHQGGKNFTDFYIDRETIDFGKHNFTSGQISLEIIVSDYAGNETAVTINFSVSG